MKQINYVELAKKIVLDLIDRERISVFLFGSRATGKVQHASDLDIGFISDEKIEPQILRKKPNGLKSRMCPIILIWLISVKLTRVSEELR